MRHKEGGNKKSPSGLVRSASATSILREYCGVGVEKESGCPPCTPSARYKLHAWKAVTVVPVSLAMPVLLARRRSEMRRGEGEEGPTAARAGPLSTAPSS